MKSLKTLLLSLIAFGAATSLSLADDAKAKADCKACCEKKVSGSECCKEACDGCCKKEETKCDDAKKCDDTKKCDMKDEAPAAKK